LPNQLEIIAFTARKLASEVAAASNQLTNSITPTISALPVILVRIEVIACNCHL